MKKTGLVALLLTAACGVSSAQAQQRFEITPFVGYQFGGSVGLINGDLKIGDDLNYGVILDYTLRPGAQIELSYNRQDTELRLVPFIGTIQTVPMSVEYFQIGGLGYIDRGKAAPFLSATLGATHYNPDAQSIGGRTIDNEWRFSMVLGGGVKILPSQRVGIRLGGQVLATFLDTGGGLWCGGGGCSLGLFGSGILQGAVDAGLIVRF